MISNFPPTAGNLPQLRILVVDGFDPALESTLRRHFEEIGLAFQDVGEAARRVLEELRKERFHQAARDLDATMADFGRVFSGGHPTDTNFCGSVSGKLPVAPELRGVLWTPPRWLPREAPALRRSFGPRVAAPRVRASRWASARPRRRAARQAAGPTLGSRAA